MRALGWSLLAIAHKLRVTPVTLRRKLRSQEAQIIFESGKPIRMRRDLIDPKRVSEMRAYGLTQRQIAKELGVSTVTLWKAMREAKQQEKNNG